MLSVESFGPGGDGAQTAEASRVLIRDAFGNPICLAVSWEEDGEPKTIVAHLLDDDFEDLLRTFGVDRVAVVRRVYASGG